MARTAFNKQAGEWLRRVRSKRRASTFARQLAEALKSQLASGTLYAYERGDRTVPAAVLLAASAVTGEPIAMNPDARRRFVDEVADELERRRREREGE